MATSGCSEGLRPWGRRKNGGRLQGHWADLPTGSRSQAWVTHYHCNPTQANSLSSHFSPCSCRTQCGQGTPTPLEASCRPGSCSLVWSPEVSPLLAPGVPSLPPLAGTDGLCDPGVARSQVWKIKGPFPSLPKWVKAHDLSLPIDGNGKRRIVCHNQLGRILIGNLCPVYVRY